MTDPVDLLGIYIHLARASELRRRCHVRDRLLVLAGVTAARLGMPRISQFCRQKIFEHNPNHAVRRWGSIEVALEDSDFLHLLRTIQRRYPLEKAERMMDSLGILREHERDTYYTDEEYAAALLGTNLEQLNEMFGPAHNE
jgi:hypothetical protein